MNLEDIFPTVLAHTRNRNAKLEPADEQKIDDLTNRIELGVVEFKECIKELIPIKRKYDRTGVDKEGNPKSSLALPVKFIQIILYISYMYSEMDQDKIGQDKILDEFKLYDTNLNKKIFMLESTVQDYRDLIKHTQPDMHIKYQGQKHDKLGVAIKNLVFQAGKHSYFVDLFGGSGAGTLAVPRRNNTKYVYNDSDGGLVCLYKVLSDKQLSKLLIEYLHDLKYDLEDVIKEGETTSASRISRGIDFASEVVRFNKDKNIKETRKNIQEWALRDDFEWVYGDGGSIHGNFYDYIKYFLESLELIHTDEANALKNRLLWGSEGDIEISNVVLGCITGSINFSELLEFAKNNGLYMMNVYSVNSNGLTQILDFDERSEQYRYFEWYAYFSNCLDIVRDKSNDERTKQLLLSNNEILVMIALAEIYTWSFLHGDKQSLSPIHKIIHADGTKSKEHLKFTNKLQVIIKRIEFITKLISDGKTIVAVDDCINVINEYKKLTYYSMRSNGKIIEHIKKVLYYNDSPYIATTGYKAGKWGTGNSTDLIDALISSKQKFIFSCRACATTGNKDKGIKANNLIYDAVLNYFRRVVEAENEKLGKKKTGRMSLWVTYINLDKLSLEDAITQHKCTEIMITNYEVQSFGSPDTFSVMTYDEFMTIVDKHLKRNVTESDNSTN